MRQTDFFEGDAKAVSRYWDKFERLRAAEKEVGQLLILKGDMLLVEKLPPVEIRTASGLVVGNAQATHKGTMADACTEFGLVLAVGPGQLFEDGSLQACDSQPGDIVMLPGNVFWYSMFGHINNYANYTIGRVRDAQIPIWVTNYQKVFDVLNGV